ncbi:MAG TPA: tetratricopeptide repeat protein [Coriobacteriia bacterium]
MDDTEDGTDHPGRREEQLVPAWLAALVLVLLLAVAGLAGYAAHARLSPTGPRDAADIAVAKARASVEAHPSDLSAHLDLGFAYQLAGQYAEAIREYDIVLAKDPRNSAATYNKGMAYFQLKDPKKAEELLWKVLKAEPTHALAAKALGEYYAGKRQYKSLVVAVKPAADARPDMADLQYLMGLAYENTGRGEWAIGRYRDALKYVPDMPEARAGLKRLGVAR